MTYPNTSNAWAFSDAKSAALYFEKAHLVAPAWLGEDEDIEKLLAAAGCNLDPFVTLAAPKLFILGEAAIAVQEAGVRALFETQGKSFPPAPLLERADDSIKELVSRAWTLQLAVATGISGPGSVLLPISTVHDDPQGDPSLLLSGLSLVDTSTLSWKQILEMRADKDTHRKLRRLRLFLYDECRNKEASFIRDDLEQRIDDYHAAAKKWGAEMREGVLTAIFDSKDFALSAAATLGSILLGQPLLALPAAIPMITKIGKVSIEMRGRRRDFRTELDEDPVSFLAEIRSYAR